MGGYSGGYQGISIPYDVGTTLNSSSSSKPYSNPSLPKNN